MKTHISKHSDHGLPCIIYHIMQVYIHTSPQCQAAEVSQLPERGAGERRLLATLSQQHYMQEYGNIHWYNQ